MAYDKTYNDYIKRTSGTGMQMDEEMFKKEKAKEVRLTEEERANQFEDRREYREMLKANRINPPVGGATTPGITTQPIYETQSTQQTVNTGVQTPMSAQEQLTKQIADAQKNRQISAIEQAYKKNVGGLQAEKSTIDPMFAGQTRQAVTQGAMSKKSFSDFLAEKGLSASGLAGQGEISQNVATQGQLGDIEARRGQSLSDIARRTSEVEQARQYGIQGAESEAAMTESQNRLNDLLKRQEEARQDAIRREQFGREDARYNQEIARSETQRQQDIARQDQLIQQGYTREDAQRQAEIERVAKANQESKAERDAAQSRIDFAATINPKEDLTAKLNELEKQGVPQDDYRVIELKKARINKIANMDQADFERELANIKAIDDQQEAALAFAWKKFSSGMPADPITARLLGVEVGQVIPEQKIKEAQLALDKIRANKANTPKEKTDKQIATENYKAFEDDFRNLLISDPSKATNLVKANRDELIRQKGLSAYNSLLNQAEALTNERLKKLQNSAYNYYPIP